MNLCSSTLFINIKPTSLIQRYYSNTYLDNMVTVFMMEYFGLDIANKMGDCNNMNKFYENFKHDNLFNQW